MASSAAFLTLIIVATVSAPLRAQATQEEALIARLDSALYGHATSIMERFGDTFFVLGRYATAAGEIQSFAANWPPVDAPPNGWLDSIRAAAQALDPSVRAVGVLLDLRRPDDAARHDSTYARRWVETDSGTCVAALRRYALGPSGEVVWDPPILQPCVPHLLPVPPGLDASSLRQWPDSGGACVVLHRNVETGEPDSNRTVVLAWPDSLRPERRLLVERGREGDILRFSAIVFSEPPAIVELRFDSEESRTASRSGAGATLDAEVVRLARTLAVRVVARCIDR